MSTAHRVCTTVSDDRSVTLENLPFSAGQMVEVTVQVEHAKEQRNDRHPLQGSVKGHEEPTDSVAEEGWEANAHGKGEADRHDLEAEYREMAADEEREADALEWAEATIGDVADEAR